MTRKMPKSVNLLCKKCKQLRIKHEDWIATGEFAENVVCPTELDERGYAIKLDFFEPMDNLEYLEEKDKERDK